MIFVIKNGFDSLTLVILGLLKVALTEYAKCSVKVDLSVCFSSDPANVTAVPCSDVPICHKNFNISSIDQKPYSPEIVADLLRTCCGPCVTATEINRLKMLSEITPTLMKSSDFVFPVLGRGHDKWIYGYRYIPLLEAPRIYYITYKRDNLMQHLLMSCLSMWPLTIICVLTIMISGFICWIIETWSNEEQFPRPFMTGWFEGIWWSYISMTTVGYGDKAPKSVPARIFSVIWIFIGITTFSLVTAMLTSEISSANSLPPPKMENANVGAIRHHLHEAVMIADKGGILIDIHAENITDGIHKLICDLEKNRIDGFLLDRYELMLFYNYFEDDPQYKEDVKFLRMKTRRTEILSEKQFFYGVLVKNEEDYEFLADFMMSNRYVIDSCNSLFLSMYSRKVYFEQNKPALFSAEGGLFWPSFTFCSIVVAIITICGAIYELYRSKRLVILKHNEGLLC